MQNAYYSMIKKDITNVEISYINSQVNLYI